MTYATSSFSFSEIAFGNKQTLVRVGLLLLLAGIMVSSYGCNGLV